MDSKDFQLLVQLYENARQSYRSLGRHVSLTAPAVRERLKRLERNGVLQGYWLSLDPSIFNRGDLLVVYQGDWTRADAVKMLSVPDVAWVALKLDGSITVQVWPYDEEKTVSLLNRTLNAKPSMQASSKPLPHSRLSTLDFQVIDALIDDPVIPFARLVELTGLSPKTARKHLVKLIHEEVVSVTPRLGALSDSGQLVYHLAIVGQAAPSELRRVLGGAFLIKETQDPPLKYLLCRGNDLADVTTKTRTLGKLPGVESVVVTLNRELLVGTEFVHKLVRQRIHDLKGASHERLGTIQNSRRSLFQKA